MSGREYSDPDAGRNETPYFSGTNLECSPRQWKGIVDDAMEVDKFKIVFTLVMAIFVVFGGLLISTGHKANSNVVNPGIINDNLPASNIALGVFLILSSITAAVLCWKDKTQALWWTVLFNFIMFVLLFFIGIAIAKDGVSDEKLLNGWNDSGYSAKLKVQDYFFCCGILAFNDSHTSCPTPPPAPDCKTAPCPPDPSVVISPCFSPIHDYFNDRIRQASITSIGFGVLILILYAGLFTYAYFTAPPSGSANARNNNKNNSKVSSSYGNRPSGGFQEI